ncbi:Acetyltransferase (GNAT) family protein [Rhodoblastus acidophilus]|uniref:Acetyltransferase (GNAT) family protein n=2 Tax=Rhodoblastus acidophilus TaxID=1074 RepID=A0A212QLJ6_RHOAC|nr:Acetyltransferase (GNAT) family protein [Rhodoblastus acidophilus]
MCEYAAGARKPLLCAGLRRRGGYAMTDDHMGGPPLIARETGAQPPRLFRLGPQDADRYADHLLRLDDEDRRFRFFDDAPEFMIMLHAGAAASDGRIALGFEEGGEIRAVGELLADPARPEVGELAFSVEKGWRRHGLGAALMGGLIEAGARAGFSTLELEFLANNAAMQALARRFTPSIVRRDGRVVATIASAG